MSRSQIVTTSIASTTIVLALVVWFSLSSESKTLSAYRRDSGTKESAQKNPSLNKSDSAKSLKNELEMVEGEFEAMRPKKVAAYQAWRQPGGEIDYWHQYLQDNGQWELSLEGKRAAEALQAWSDGTDGSPGLHKGQPAAAKARQRSVIAEIRRALSDPTTSASLNRYLLDYINAPAADADNESEEAFWNNNMQSFPPRRLVADLLNGVDIDAQLAPEQGVPEGVLDYMRLQFEHGLRDMIVAHYIERSKPQSLREMEAQWESLNERRFAILKQLGVEVGRISKY